MLTPVEDDGESSCSEMLETEAVEDEKKAERFKKERAHQLGFVPQKEVIYNKLLPYSSHIDSESTKWFQDIKANLGRALALREIRPGFVVWVSRLNKYIRLYGLKFPLADHVSLIKLLFSVIFIPDLEPFIVNHVGSCLVSLLKKRELISGDQLEIDWRELYTLYDTTMQSKKEALGLIKIPGSLDMTLRSLIKFSRPYFPISSTSEILSELRPLMCPLDVTMGKAMSYYEMFLPTYSVAAKYPEHTYQLWYPEFFDFWTACGNSPMWEPSLVGLLARLAEDAPGLVDWGSALPVVFTRIQKMFCLPVHYNKTNVGYKGQQLDSNTAARWIVNTLGAGGQTQAYLGQLLASLESYYHPANTGKYILKLTEFLARIVESFIKRVHRERHRKPSWGYRPTSSAQLTDTDITEFVMSIKPVVFHAMWLRCLDVGSTLQSLATLRPGLILPTLVQRLYSSLETVTEPHKLTASLFSVVGVSRCLVTYCPEYPEGQTHVLPLLFATLPGIDTNDLRKSMVTFQYISTFATFIPFVNNSVEAASLNDLSEEESKIYSQSAQFEDFIVEFLNRCFAIIENSEVQQIRSEVSTDDASVSREDTMKDVGMASTFSAILIQSSQSLYDVALKKVKSWLAGRIMEWKVSGRIAAGLCRCLTKVRPERGLAGLLAPLLTSVEISLEEREGKEETLGDEIKFQMQVLAELVRVPGTFLLPYLDRLGGILTNLTKHCSKEGDLLTGALLRNLLRSLTHVFPIEYKSIARGFDQDLSTYRPLQDWGVAGDIHDLAIEWYMPGEKEVKAAQGLVTDFLANTLNKLELCAKGEVVLSREELLSRLSLVTQFVQGAGGLFHPWGEEIIILKPSNVVLKHQTHIAFKGKTPELTLDGGNARLRIVTVLHGLLAHILDKTPDDTKSLIAVGSAYQKILFFAGVQRDEYDSRWKGFQAVKKCMENKLLGSKKHIRRILVDRTHLQHESRMIENANKNFTNVHRQIYKDLLLLSTSHYAEVRIKGQEVLGKSMKFFSYSYEEVIPHLITLLKGGEGVDHEQFKGALYLILGPKGKSLLIKHNWNTFAALCPSVIEASHSEKPSIIKVFSAVQETVVHHLETLTITLRLPDSVLGPALAMWGEPEDGDGALVTSLVPSQSAPTQDEIDEGRKRMEDGNKTTLALFQEIINTLCEQLESGRLHWRHYNAGFAILATLTRYDVKLNARAVRILVNNLAHDNIVVRKTAIHTMAGVLRQHKKRHPVVQKNLEVGEDLKPGDRVDNEWLQYKESNWPQNKEDWNKPNFVHKTHYGYYIWPQKMMVYAGEDIQPRLNRIEAEMSPEEREIFAFFNDAKNLDKLVSFLSLEENKGKDKFDSRKFLMWKGLFRNYGSSILENLKAHIEKLCEDQQESHQRCAAEMVAGLIRGSKHWPWDMTKELWDWLVPVLRKLLGKVTVETIGDWGTCFATSSESRDPNRLHWLLELLMEEPLRSQGSFLDASRLYVLQGAVAQQEWRIGSLLHRLDVFLRPFLTHPYQNVRERLGSVVANIYALDISFSGGSAGGSSPSLAPLVADVFPQLAMMKEEPDQELYNFHKAVSRTPEDLGPDDFQKILEKLPKELSAKVGEQGLETLKILLSGKLPSVKTPTPEMLSSMQEMLKTSQGNMSMTAVLQGLRQGSPNMLPPGIRMSSSPGSTKVPGPPLLPPVLQAAVSDVLASGGGGADSELAARWEERQSGVRLLQTMCKLMAGVLLRNWYSVKPELYQFLEMLALNESSELEPDLARDCNVAMACLASHIVPQAVLPTAVSAMENISMSSSWKARGALLEFVQVCVFSNLAAFYSQPDQSVRVSDVVARLLRDDRVEVREKAGKVLGGLIHCSFISASDSAKLLDQFTKEISKKIRKKPKSDEDPLEFQAKQNKSILLRHAGVLGLSSFVVACPYEIPESLPPILMLLADHLHDPVPIPATVKKVFQDFKRTHQDNWAEHKLAFTEDQLAVLTDLLVSPSYYA